MRYYAQKVVLQKYIKDKGDICNILSLKVGFKLI